MMKMRLFILVVFHVFLTEFAKAEPKREELSIAMFLWRGITQAERGFFEAMEKKGIRSRYDIFDLSADADKLARVIREILDSGREYDYLYSFGTNASLMIRGSLGKKFPQVFNISSVPLESGLVEGLLRRESNLSGATNFIAFEAQFRVILEHVNVRHVMYLFNPREKNGTILMKKFQGFSKKNRLRVTYRRTPSEERLRQALEEIPLIQPDLVYFPNDSFLNSRAEKIIARLRKFEVTSAAAHGSFIREGVGIGVVPNYRKLGEGVAEIIEKNLKGEPLKNIPIFVDRSPKVILNLVSEH